MSLQDSTFNTAHILDNEIVKANDFEFAFEKIAENVAKATQMILESNQDFVINGKVLPYQGMNVKVSPIYGVCKSTGVPFGRTEEAIMEYGFEESTSGRVDIIEVRGEWETYDNQQRAFNDPDTNVQTYQYVDTKKLMRPAYKIKKGVEGSSVAPEVDDGYVKLAEVVIRANNSEIDEEDIKNITADIAGLANDDWTTQPDITYNIGYISDVNERFRVQHNEDGTHKDDAINSDSLDIGTGSKQINGNILPIGAIVSIPTQTVSATDTIVSVITKAATMITSLYNSYLKYGGEYKFKGAISISEVVDANNQLKKPLTFNSFGNGTAKITLGSEDILGINENGTLTAKSGYTPSDSNDLVTKAVTDAISTSLSNLATRVTNIENTLGGQEVYINKVLSTDRLTVASINITAATTANITLSGTQTIDGVSLTVNQKVLVKNQTNAKENGIYNVESSTWTRPTDYNTPNKIKGKIFNVTNGTANGGKMFYNPTETFSDGSAFGTDNIDFVEFIGSIAKLANKLVMRDSSGRIKTETPSANEDAVNKGFLTINNLGLPSGIVKVTSATAAGTAAKTADLSGFALVKGAKLLITFTNANTSKTALTLNVNSTGAKSIYINGVASSATVYSLSGTYIAEYDGSVWRLDNGYMTANARSANSISGIVAVANGGTGANCAATARTNLGVPPTSHASTATSYGVGNASNYGHVKVSDTYDSTADGGKNTNSIAASQYAVGKAYAEARCLGNAVNYYKLQANATAAASDSECKVVLGVTESYTKCSCTLANGAVQRKVFSSIGTFTCNNAKAGYTYIETCVCEKKNGSDTSTPTRFCFCSNGYMYGNVCGNLCGTASSVACASDSAKLGGTAASSYALKTGCVSCAGANGSGTAFGSAATKTAGAAAGNVPLVGTALGTTNGQFVATDSSGCLKPSGYTASSFLGVNGCAADSAKLGGKAATCYQAAVTEVTCCSMRFTILYKTTNQMMFTYENNSGTCISACCLGKFMACFLSGQGVKCMYGSMQGSGRQSAGSTATDFTQMYWVSHGEGRYSPTELSGSKMRRWLTNGSAEDLALLSCAAGIFMANFVTF